MQTVERSGAQLPAGAPPPPGRDDAKGEVGAAPTSADKAGPAGKRAAATAPETTSPPAGSEGAAKDTAQQQTTTAATDPNSATAQQPAIEDAAGGAGGKEERPPVQQRQQQEEQQEQQQRREPVPAAEAAPPAEAAAAAPATEAPALTEAPAPPPAGPEGGVGEGQQRAPPPEKPEAACEPRQQEASGATPPPKLQKLQGQLALVLGAACPLGREVTRQLAAAGARVILASPHPEDARRVAKMVSKQCPQAQLLVTEARADYKSPKNLAAVHGELRALIGGSRLRLVVNTTAALWGAPRGLWRRCYTDQGVSGRAQALALGPFALLQLLSDILVASGTRVVSVAPATHRAVALDPQRFVYRWGASTPPHAALATVALSWELQRRLGPQGAQAVVVDPGVLREELYSAVPFGSLPPARQVLDALAAPASEGAAAVLHAAVAEWEGGGAGGQGGDGGGDGKAPEEDLRLYAKGLMASPLLTQWDACEPSLLALATWPAYCAALVAHAAADYPARLWGRLTPKAMAAGGASAAAAAAAVVPRVVPAASASYRRYVGAQLWEAAEELLVRPAAKLVKPEGEAEVEAEVEAPAAAAAAADSSGGE